MMDILLTDFGFTDDLQVSPTGDLDTMSGEINLKESLFRRLITEKGSLLHRPGYGVGVKNYLNGPNSLSAQQKLAADIIENYEQDPRVVKVTEVRSTRPNDNPSAVIIAVKLIRKGQQQEQQFLFQAEA